MGEKLRDNVSMRGGRSSRSLPFKGAFQTSGGRMARH